MLDNSQHGWYIPPVTFTVEIEREDDGRWLAEVPALSGALAYGEDRDEAVARVQALALRVIAEKHCDGKLVACLEGGYNLRALAASARVVADEWAERESVGEPSTRAR